MIDWIIFIGSIIILMGAIGGVSIWITNSTSSCNHLYKRIDDYNDKKMILVCCKCGKIKKLRK